MAVISWLPTGAAKSEPVVEPIMITVESAVSDTLTVTAVGQEPQTCVTDVNGIGTMSLMPDVEYTFTSSVAKAIDNSGADYSKTITLTKDMDGSLVKIMPDGAIRWSGNPCEDITSWSGNPAGGGTLEWRTNTIYLATSNGPSQISIYANAGYNPKRYTKLHIRCKNVPNFASDTTFKIFGWPDAGTKIYTSKPDNDTFVYENAEELLPNETALSLVYWARVASSFEIVDVWLD